MLTTNLIKKYIFLDNFLHHIRAYLANLFEVDRLSPEVSYESFKIWLWSVWRHTFCKNYCYM